MMMTQANRFTSRASYRRMIGYFHSIRALEMLLFQAFLRLSHQGTTDCHCIKDGTPIDPACGTGGMLIEAIRHINNDHMTYGKIYGQEKNLSTSAIARMNLFLHGAREFKIAQGDTLTDPSFIEGNHLKTFDCVLANPPFSLKRWGSKSFENDRYGRNIWG